MSDPAVPESFAAFAALVRSRRSVRAFLPDPVPEETSAACLDLALLAPNSHNLEPWQFIEVRDPALRAALAHCCLGQQAAVQAPLLIACIARPDFWRMGARLMLDALARETAPVDPLLVNKYQLQIPLIFADGPLHVLAPLKRLACWVAGLFGPFWRVDVGRSGQVLWATKTTALACQTLMLALRAAGYDSCAMEGFDEPRAKRLLHLPHPARIVMILAAGNQAPGGLLPQWRFPRENYVSRL